MLTDQTRYRITGTIFIVAVLAIVVPLLFDGAGVAPVQMPPMPPVDVEVTPSAEPTPDITPLQRTRDQLALELDEDGFDRETGTRLGDVRLLPEEEPSAGGTRGDHAPLRPEPSTGRVGAPTASESVSAESEEASSVVSEQGRITDLKWAVQVASFGQRDNALRQRDQLLADGFEAFVSDAKTDGLVMTRVAVGPMIDRDVAERTRAELEQRYASGAVVVRFSP